MEAKTAYPIFKKLLPLLAEVAIAFKGVPIEVADIKEALDIIKMRAAAEQDNRHMRQLREEAFRIEYLIEAYLISEEQQPRNPGCEILLYLIVDFIKTLILRLQVAYEIPDMKSCVTEINELESGSSTCTGSQNDTWQSLQDEAWHIEEAEVVGFEAQKAELIGWFGKKPEERTVISVVGMGGQGKTALAKTVYDKVKGDFPCHARIKVPRSYCTKEDLLKEILKKFSQDKKQAPPEGISKMDPDSLIDKVKDHLWEQRYVIFFDDIWNINFWSQIEVALPNNKNGSRILITTRNKEVAENCKESFGVHVHNLQPLTNSWKLICKKVFQNQLDGCYLQQFKSKNFEIVKKCEGLPLGIMAIGRLCRKVANQSDWKKLDNDLSSELRTSYFPRITKILGFSFDDLPYSLKSCFLYFGIYPENYEVECTTLIKQWIAEGFVRYEKEKTLEEVAEQNLEKLIHRSLVQVSSFSIDCKPKRCRVHALMREMILKKIEDLSFCHFVREDSVFIRRLQIANNPMNLKATTELPDDSVKNYLIEHIQSLHVFRCEELSEDFVNKIPTRYRLLKVLDFEHVSLNSVPQNLGNLFHLRYLSFRKTNIESLPNSIGNLHYLETLDLRQTRVRQIPREINKLKKLRHLLANYTSWGSDYGIQMMEGIGGLVSLQTLRQVETNHRGVKLVEELEQLKQLRLLGLIHVKREYISALCSSINKMKHLKKLHIDAIDEVIDLLSISPVSTLQKLRLRGKLERLPEWIPKLQKLVKLSLMSSKLTDDSFKSVKDMPNLLSLSLDSAYEGENLHFKNGGFKELKKLSLRYLHSLNSIIVDEKALPLLKEFKLEYIPELKEVPSGIHHLGKLEVLSLMSTALSDDPLKSLKNMPNLLSLSLDSAYEGENLHFEDGGFQKLKKLSLRHLHSLNSIIVGERALPLLEEFELEDIPQLKKVPSGIHHLGNLGVFHITDMPEEFRRRIREEQWINKHVLQVNIAD